MANAYPKKKVVDHNDKARWNLRVPSSLDKWARDYAKKNGTNLTTLILAHFTELREKEEADSVPQF